MTRYQPLRYVYQPAPNPATHNLLLHGTGSDEHGRYC